MTTENGTNQSQSVQGVLTKFATKLEQSKAAREGEIVLNLSGEQGGNYVLAHQANQVTLQESAGESDVVPLIEVSADSQVIHDILEGRKDAAKQFLLGKLRIKGDLRYFSDLALEMNILKKPL